MILINPGTESRSGATEANAVKIARDLAEDVGFSGDPVRVPKDDRDGWFSFMFGSVRVDVPGDDPETVCAGRPFEARRLYVDGMSWLYGFAAGQLSRRLSS